MSVFRLIKQQRYSATNKRYQKRAARVTDQWDISDTPCDCETSTNDKEHKKIRFQTTDGNEFVCCPIHFYILTAWKMMTRKKKHPPRSLLTELLGGVNDTETGI